MDTGTLVCLGVAALVVIFGLAAISSGNSGSGKGRRGGAGAVPFFYTGDSGSGNDSGSGSDGGGFGGGDGGGFGGGDGGGGGGGDGGGGGGF